MVSDTSTKMRVLSSNISRGSITKKNSKAATTKRGVKMSQFMDSLENRFIKFMKGPDGEGPSDTSAQTNKLCTWRCTKAECLHEFFSSGGNVIGQGFGCPYCCFSPRKICPSSKKCKPCIRRSVAEYKIVEDLQKRHIAYDCELNTLLPEEVTRSSSTKFWWTCTMEDCQHVFKSTPNNVISGGRGCPYCSVSSRRFCDEIDKCTRCISRSLGSEKITGELKKRDIVALGGPSQNQGTRRSIFTTAAGSADKCLFRCIRIEGHGNFEASACDVVGSGTGCPRCTNKTENSLLEYMEKSLEGIEGISWKRQGRLPNSYKRRYDSVLIVDGEPRVVVEIDGGQHFDVGYFGSHVTDPEYQRKNDVSKTLAASEYSVSTIRIASFGKVPNGDRLRRLGDSLVEAVIYAMNSSIPVIKCIDIDHPGCYSRFLCDLLMVSS